MVKSSSKCALTSLHKGNILKEVQGIFAIVLFEFNPPLPLKLPQTFLTPLLKSFFSLCSRYTQPMQADELNKTITRKGWSYSYLLKTFGDDMSLSLIYWF